MTECLSDAAKIPCHPRPEHAQRAQGKGTQRRKTLAEQALAPPARRLVAADRARFARVVLALGPLPLRVLRTLRPGMTPGGSTLLPVPYSLPYGEG